MICPRCLDNMIDIIESETFQTRVKCCNCLFEFSAPVSKECISKMWDVVKKEDIQYPTEGSHFSFAEEEYD